MPLPQTLALLRAAADAGSSVVLDAETCGELVRAVQHAPDAFGEPVPTAEAARIMGLVWDGQPEAKRESALRRLRRAATRWERMEAHGRRPEVRVRRRGPSPASDWLFSREDGFEYRRARGAVRLVGSPVGSPAGNEGEDDGGTQAPEAEAIADAIFREHFT